MSSRSFCLKPFESAGELPHFTITGNIGRQANKLFINYTLSGILDDILVPQPSDMPCRRNALWEETCFEFFLGLKNSERYWEFNLSPAGHWNVYSFSSCREGMHEEASVVSLPFLVSIQPEAFVLSLEFNLDKLVSEGQDLEVGISAVVKTEKGKISYWALDHPGPQADFHRRDSFIVDL